MDGRARGVLLLALALLATAVGAGLHLHVRPGVAMAQPPAGPPAVGSCVPDASANTTWGFQFDSGASSATYTPEFPAGTFVSCRGTRFGEVVDVIPQVEVVTMRRTDAGLQVSDPTSQRCAASVRAYLGTTATAASRFAPPELGSSTLLGPDDRQKAAGQHWVSCQVTAFDDNGSPAPLAGSARDLWTTGADRNQLGACQPQVQWANGPVGGSCATRHRSELLGYADLSRGAMPTRDALESDCQTYARRAIGRTDLSGGGRIQVGVRVFADGSSLDTGRTVSPDSLVVCGVETLGDAALTSSLIAWGEGPLPLA